MGTTFGIHQTKVGPIGKVGPTWSSEGVPMQSSILRYFFSAIPLSSAQDSDTLCTFENSYIHSFNQTALSDIERRRCI